MNPEETILPEVRCTETQLIWVFLHSCFFSAEKLVCLLLFLVSKDILNGWLKINYSLTRNNLCIIGIV